MSHFRSHNTKVIPEYRKYRNIENIEYTEITPVRKIIPKHREKKTVITS